MPPNKHYRDILIEEFERRKSSNSNYSLRAFARDLKVNRTSMSEVLSGKRNLSLKNAIKIFNKMNLSEKQKEKLIAQVRGESLKVLDDDISDLDYIQLEDDKFKFISDWFYIGILLLSKIKNHKADAMWISKRLQIPEDKVNGALILLRRLGLIEIKNNKIIRLTPPFKTTHNVPSKAIKSYHRQNLRLAEESLENKSLEKRIFSAISIPIKTTRLKEMDALITQFKENISKLFGADDADEIYTLSIQLFPITH